MSGNRRELTMEDIDNIDIDELLKLVEEDHKRRKLRKDNPWVRDIIRVLWGFQSWITMDRLTRELWALRNPSGLPMPKKFQETVQSALNRHTSQSQVFKGPEEDDLFYSPKGKRSGTWALRSRACAVAWLKARTLSDV